jgi:hypothetical protein
MKVGKQIAKPALMDVSVHLGRTAVVNATMGRTPIRVDHASSVHRVSFVVWVIQNRTVLLVPLAPLLRGHHMSTALNVLLANGQPTIFAKNVRVELMERLVFVSLVHLGITSLHLDRIFVLNVVLLCFLRLAVSMFQNVNHAMLLCTLLLTGVFVITVHRVKGTLEQHNTQWSIVRPVRLDERLLPPKHAKIVP